MKLNWEFAEEWRAKANKNSEGKWERPEWEWDCNFKLDFDGPLLRFSSRFYPPHKNNHDGWEGTVTLFLITKELHKKEFKCDNLDQLQKEVEKYLAHWEGIILSKLS